MLEGRWIWRSRWWREAAHDVRHAWRALTAAPRLAALGVVTVGLGNAAAVLLASAYGAVVLRALPFEHAERLTSVKYARGTSASQGPLALPAARRLAETGGPFTAIAHYGAPHLRVIRTGGGAEATFGVRVSPIFFPTLGMAPLLGRWFAPDESEPGRNDVVILSHGLWTRSFGADPKVVGTVLRLDDTPVRVVGVMPASFAFPDSHVRFWMPEPISTITADDHRSHDRWTFARLRDGIEPSQAQASLQGLAVELRALDAESYENLTFSVTSLQDEMIGPVRKTLLLMWGAVGCILLVTCANLINLLLVRSIARERIIAVMMVLGASRARVVRMVLCESLIMAAFGAVLAVAVSMGGASIIRNVGPVSIPRIDQVNVDPTAIGIGVALAILTALLAAFVPALRMSATNPARALGSGTSASVPAGRSGAAVLQQTLCALQLAVGVVLSIGATLLGASLYRLQHIPLGFDADRILNVQFMPKGNGDAARHSAEALLDDVKRIPGVTDAALTNLPPLLGALSTMPLRVETRREGWTATPFVSIRTISAGYFRTLGVPIVNGRAFSADDQAKGPCVIMINDAAAKAFWSGEDPVRHRVDLDGAGRRSFFCEVVGVAADARTVKAQTAPAPEFYFFYTQRGDHLSTLLVRTDPEVRSPRKMILASALAASSVPQAAAVWDVDKVLRDSWREPRFRAVSLTLFAIPAFLLATLGAYGITAFVVSRRMREIGIRMALGANRGMIVRDVIGRAALFIVPGVTLGIGAALASARVVAGLLFETEPVDQIVFIMVPLMLAAAAFLASYLPTVAAARLTPRTLSTQE